MMKADAGQSTVREQFRSLPATFAPASKSKFHFSSNSTPKNINKFEIENVGQQNAVRLPQAAALSLCWPIGHRPRSSQAYVVSLFTDVFPTFSTFSNIFYVLLQHYAGIR